MRQGKGKPDIRRILEHAQSGNKLPRNLNKRIVGNINALKFIKDVVGVELNSIKSITNSLVSRRK